MEGRWEKWRKEGREGGAKSKLRDEIPFQGKKLEVSNGGFGKWAHCVFVCVKFPPREYLMC